MHVTIDKGVAKHGRAEQTSRYCNNSGSDFRGVTYDQLRSYEESYPPIANDETMKLVRLAQARNEEAAELLIKHNSRKIMLFAIQAHTGRRRNNTPHLWSIHRAYALSLEDCIAIASSAFWDAIMLYDEKRWSPVAGATVRFSSWANLIILQRLGGAITQAKKRDVNYPMERHGPATTLDFGEELKFGMEPRQAGDRALGAPVAESIADGSSGPEQAFAKERLGEIIERAVGREGRALVEEWACKLTAERRHEISRAYHDALKALRESVDLEELAALRETILS